MASPAEIALSRGDQRFVASCREDQMRAHVLSIGSELILGHLTDSNATFLAQELAAFGIELLHVTQVGDNRERLSATLRAACAEADLVICTGGVGPTDDDLTREAIADLVGETPVVDPDLLMTVQSFFAGRGLVMPSRNAKQAWLIPSAEALENPVGTAPGWFVRYGATSIVAMPGVPREMYRMWREQALPRIEPYLPRRSLRSITFKTIGIGESAAEQLLDELVKQQNPSVATYAKDDGVHVRVTAIGSNDEEAERLRKTTASAVWDRIGQFTYASDETTLARALLRLLAERDLSIGVIEHGTGGRFGSMLANEASAPGILHGSLTTAEFDHGDGGRDAALNARRAREQFNARLGVAVTAQLKPVEQGLYTGSVTVATDGDEAYRVVEAFAYRSAFGEIQRRSAMNAADVLRRALIGRSDI